MRTHTALIAWSLLMMTALAACVGAPAAVPTAVPPTPAPPTAVPPTAVPTLGPNAELRDIATARNFYVGAAVNTDALAAEPEYARVLGASFNQVTPENVMKFGLIHPSPGYYDWGPADALVKFAEDHGMRVHGHTLLWHQQLPPFIEDPKLTPADATKAMEEHIAAVVGRYKGRIAEWDVVNEAIDDNARPRDSVWRRLVGPDYIEKAFRLAHAADPAAKLFYNDYNGEEMNAKSDAIYTMLRDLKQRGVPIDGVGLQMHITLAGPPDAKQVAENIRRLSDLGLLVHISEMDVRQPIPPDTAALKRQGRAYREILQVCLAAPNCTEFTTWGFTDKHSWVPDFFPGFGDALLFDDQYKPKPAYDMLKDTLRAATK